MTEVTEVTEMTEMTEMAQGLERQVRVPSSSF